MTIDCGREEFRIRSGLWEGHTLFELYRQAQTPFEWHEALFARARDVGITMFSTPFDKTAIELLEEVGAPAYKIASFEIVDLSLIACAARTGKPLIISTGMASLEEISDAVAAARENGCTELILLHCISGYPTPVSEMNLRTIPDLASTYDVHVGLSDHTLGTTAAIASVALGATVIEKHFTLSRADGGLDSAFSIEPQELAGLATAAREAWQALGTAAYDLKSSEAPNARFRRSLYVVENISAGASFTEENIKSIRPGYGLPPKFLNVILGKRAACDLARGTPLDWSMIE